MYDDGHNFSQKKWAVPNGKPTTFNQQTRERGPQQPCKCEAADILLCHLPHTPTHTLFPHIVTFRTKEMSFHTLTMVRKSQAREEYVIHYMLCFDWVIYFIWVLFHTVLQNSGWHKGGRKLGRSQGKLPSTSCWQILPSTGAFWALYLDLHIIVLKTLFLMK